GIKLHLIDELFGRRPRLNLFADHVIFAMVWRFLNQIKPSGHGDFEVSKATLQHPGSNNAFLAVPACVGEAQIHLADSENGGERFGLAGSSAIQAGGRLYRAPPRALSRDRTRHTCKPLYPPSRHRIKSKIVKRFIPVSIRYSDCRRPDAQHSTFGRPRASQRMEPYG